MRCWILGLIGIIALAMPAQARWREASTDHFLIYSEESPEALRDYATKLERYDGALRHMRGNLPTIPGAANRLTIYVVDGLSEVRRLHAKGQRGVGGFYLPRAEGSIAITPRRTSGVDEYSLDSETILLHEYAHHFMMQNFPRAYPAWFVEGFAEFYSTTKFEKDGSLGLGLPAMHRARGFALPVSLPIEDILGGTNRKFGPMERESLYGRGWLLTHYLYFSDSRKGQLNRYIVAINEGKAPLDAAKDAFGDPDALQRELDTYLKQRTMKYVKLVPQAFKVGDVKIRDLSEAENAVMDVKIRSRRGGGRKQAEELLPDVRRAAAPYLNDAAAQATLAEAEFHAGNHAEAEAAADRALAADPKSGDALLVKGKVKLALARARQARDPKSWLEARRWFVAANKLDPLDPEPLILFYQSFVAAGAEPTANSVSGLLEAYALAPHDPDLRMQAAAELLKKKDIDGARSALGPVAFNPHGGRITEIAARILAMLDSRETEAALRATRQGLTDSERERTDGQPAPEGEARPSAD